MAQWEIGNYKFHTREEYRAGLRDMGKIQKILKCSDVENPKTALELYNAVRDRRIIFESIVGQRFTDFLITQFLNRFDEVKHQAKEKSVGRVMIRKTKAAIAACCVVTVLASSSYFAYYYLSEYKSTQALKELSESVARSELQMNASSVDGGKTVLEAVDPGIPKGVIEAGKKDNLEVLTKYNNLYMENKDLAGWIKIEGTVIDYPVILTPGEEYYLNRNFKKKDDLNGLPFLNKETDLAKHNTNMIIYGHHMKTGEMFGRLQDYKNKKYWEEHKIIEFDTIYEEGQYEVMAVFPSRVYGQEENVFKYYQFVNAKTEEEFQYFLSNVKSLSLYDTGIEAKYGDTFITLSTCDYEEEDGRFVVVARKIEKENSKEVRDA